MNFDQIKTAALIVLGTRDISYSHEFVTAPAPAQPSPPPAPPTGPTDRLVGLGKLTPIHVEAAAERADDIPVQAEAFDVAHVLRVVIDQEASIDAPNVFADVLIIRVIVFSEDECLEVTRQVMIVENAARPKTRRLGPQRKREAIGRQVLEQPDDARPNALPEVVGQRVVHIENDNHRTEIHIWFSGDRRRGP